MSNIASDSEFEVHLEFVYPKGNNPEIQYESFRKILAVRNDFADFYSKFISDAYPEKLKVDGDNKVRFNFKMRINPDISSDVDELTVELARYKDKAKQEFELDFDVHIVV